MFARPEESTLRGERRGPFESELLAEDGHPAGRFGTGGCQKSETSHYFYLYVVLDILSRHMVG